MAESYGTYADLKEDDKPEKPPKDKRACIGLYVALLVIVGLVIAIIVLSLQIKHHKEEVKPCQRSSCVEAAGKMLAKMDEKIKPCHDFFDYACDTFVKTAAVPPHYRKYGTFQIVNDNNEAIVKRALDEPDYVYKGQNSTAIQKAKLYYRTCINEDAYEKVPHDELKKVIKDLGSWPVLDDKVAGKFDPKTWKVEHALARAFWYHQHPLIRITIAQDDENNDVTRIKFHEGYSTLRNHHNYRSKNPKYRDIYVKSILDLSKLLGGTGKDEEIAKEAWEFEAEMIKIHEKRHEEPTRVAAFHRLKVSEVQKLFGKSFDVKEFLKGVVGRTVPDTEEVIVLCYDYLKRLPELLHKTHPRALATYIVFKAMLAFVPFMPTPFQEIKQDIRKVIYGTQPGQRWKECVSHLNHRIGFASGALFVERVKFDEKERKDVEGILKDIRAELVKKLEHVTWMDKETREAALKKAKAMGWKIGYPDLVKSPITLDEYYQDLVIKDNEPLQNELNHKHWEVKKEVDMLGKPPNRKKWDMYPAKVNAYYSERYNSMVFPAGILQGAFYNKNLPKSAVFGAVGVVMGHEMTHGYDNHGRFYDEKGNLKNWYTKKSSEEFKKNAKCLVEEYSHYKYKGHHLHGSHTLPENIADNNGLDMAYKAYKTWASKATYKEEPLPALNMTSDQLFFLSYSQLWCTYYTPEYALQSLFTDKHTYAKYRINVALTNSEAFAKAFKCPAGSPMNPKSKCKVF